jgi:hypothetical protein
VFPPVWEKIEELITQGHLRATEEVLHELKMQDDEMYRWARSQPDFIVPIDEAIQLEVRDILRHHPKLIDERKNRSGADPFVIALAAVNDATVVCNELPSRAANRPHIPDVCAARGIELIDFLTLLRREGWSLR